VGREHLLSGGITGTAWISRRASLLIITFIASLMESGRNSAVLPGREGKLLVDAGILGSRARVR